MTSSTTAMKLTMLPVDILRPVLTLVDAESLGQLFSTFDRKLQSLLLRPHMLTSLSMNRTTHKTKEGAYRYWISSLRDVDSVRLEKGCEWSPQTVLHLSTLNPLRLVLKANSLHESVFKLLNDVLNAARGWVVEDSVRQSLPSLQRIAEHFLPCGLPNFALLTTRLEILELSKLDHLQRYSEWSILPSMPLLKRFSGAIGMGTSHIALLPSTLESLTLTSPPDALCFETVLTQFPSLQYLKLDKCYAFKPLPNSFVIPTSLTHVELYDTEGEAVTFIDNPSLQHVPLTTLAYTMESNPEAGTYDLGFLPKTLTSLTLDINLYYYYGDEPYVQDWGDSDDDEGEEEDGVEVPKRIETFGMNDYKFNNDDDYPHQDIFTSFPMWIPRLVINSELLQRLKFVDFNQMTHLEYLHVFEGSRMSGSCTSMRQLPIYQHPLKTLIISTEYISGPSPVEIPHLPLTLTHLSLYNFALEYAEALVERLPNCRILVYNVNSAEGREHVKSKFSRFWSPHMDLVALSNALDRYYTHELGIAFLHGVSWFSLLTRYGANDPISGALGLAWSPPSLGELTSVVVPPSANGILDHLPPGLTSLTCLDRPCTFTKWPFTALTRLNLPTTRFEQSYWKHLRNMDELQVTITELEDFQVESFLTTFLSRRARMNALLTLEVFITGALLEIDATHGLTHVTWPLIHEKSQTILTQRLALPMPPISADAAEMDTYEVDNDHIGRIVKSITYKVITVDIKRRFLTLPSYAISAQLHPIGKRTRWKFATNPLHALEPNDTGLRIASSTNTICSFPLRLPPQLTSLDLHGVVIDPENFMVFPPTLRRLTLVFDAPIDVVLPWTWPSQLDTLVLSPHHHSPLPIWSELPSSLQHLALIGNCFQRDWDANRPRMSLPLLKTFHLNDAHATILVGLSQQLPLAKLDKFIIRDVRGKRKGKPLPTIENLSINPTLGYSDVIRNIEDSRKRSAPSNQNALFEPSVAIEDVSLD